MGTFIATFTLTTGSSINAGGFNIVGNPGSIAIANGISRAQLLTGVTYSEISDTVTGFTISSTGSCTNSIEKPVVAITPTPTPTPTPVPGDFGYTVSLGTYPVTSQGSATLTIQNTSSLDKYIWIRANSTYATSGSIDGGAAITTSGHENSISVSGTITSAGQTFDGGSSLYLPIGATYTFTVTHTSPSSGGTFYLTYTDTNTPTKTNVPLLSA